ncbi:TPR repeat-containing thioredoxin TTL1-like [Carex rostrata]
MLANGRLPTWKELVQDGDEAFKRREYGEALRQYDRAIKTHPRNVNLKFARAEILVWMDQIDEAFEEYGKAYSIHKTNGRLWHGLSLFHLRLGAIDAAEYYMLWASHPYKEALRVKIAKAKDHLVRGEKARKEDNWFAAIREIDAMIAEGVISSQRIMTFRAEMLLRLDLLDHAEGTISRGFQLQTTLTHICFSKFLGMPLEAYVWAVSAQIQLAQGRGEYAVEAAAKARRIDYSNDEISAIHTHVRLVHTGNKHYDSGDYLEALEEYTVALKYAKPSVPLLINLAACYWQLEKWKNCIEICNQLEQMLERWAESVKDYEAAIKIYPGNKTIIKKIIKGLKESQAALKKSQVTELAETLVEAQDAVKEPPVTELSETPAEAQAAVKES